MLRMLSGTLLLAAATLLIGAKPGPAAPRRPPSSSVSLTQELELTRQQEERMTALRTHTSAEIRQLTRLMEERRRELNDLYRRYEMDERRAAQLRSQIHDIQGQVLQLHHEFQIELRKLLTPAQFERLQQVLQRPRRHFRGPGRGHGSSPPSLRGFPG